eukprot:CAMPEP_0172504652 /NCGR_PEP_ID=MMETSP1066-20121228/180446_1 /TAXON_ID=671091 /ORGANISM="Coscinodiscus wailesii, Strain CCMP2513" /LENGTH=221 /DNA_ID=CAMNT_0013280927 /DNA_START=48 /DNA_END=713 /DNA_ORIENTATION=+
MVSISDRHGILCTIKVKDGKMNEFLELAKGHFQRQHDGREPNATAASILLPITETSNSVTFWEQWKTKAGYDLHSAPNENLQFFMDHAGTLFDGPPSLIETPMIHFEQMPKEKDGKSNNTDGDKYGILAELKVPDEHLETVKQASHDHFLRQFDGREPGATCAAILQTTPLHFFEQWETKADYDPKHTEGDNLKHFADTAGKLLESLDVKEYHMNHFVIKE